MSRSLSAAAAACLGLLCSSCQTAISSEPPALDKAAPALPARVDAIPPGPTPVVEISKVVSTIKCDLGAFLVGQNVQLARRLDLHSVSGTLTFNVVTNRNQGGKAGLAFTINTLPGVNFGAGAGAESGNTASQSADQKQTIAFTMSMVDVTPTACSPPNTLDGHFMDLNAVQQELNKVEIGDPKMHIDSIRFDGVYTLSSKDASSANAKIAFINLGEWSADSESKYVQSYQITVETVPIKLDGNGNPTLDRNWFNFRPSPGLQNMLGKLATQAPTLQREGPTKKSAR